MRSKPPATTSSLRSVRAGTITRRASRAPSANSHTVTSSMPSSVYSSFLYSDTLPSSHPDSIYSMPADVSSAGSMGRESHFRNYGFETVAEPEPPTSQSGEFGMSPEVPERPRSSEMASRPPPLSTDRRVVKRERERDRQADRQADRQTDRQRHSNRFTTEGKTCNAHIPIIIQINSIQAYKTYEN